MVFGTERPKEHEVIPKNPHDLTAGQCTGCRRFSDRAVLDLDWGGLVQAHENEGRRILGQRSLVR